MATAYPMSISLIRRQACPPVWMLMVTAILITMISDTFITDPAHGGPGWDTDGDGEVDLPVLPNPLTGKYPQSPTVPDGLGNATNGVPDLSSPGIELGTSVNLEWEEGLELTPSI